MLWIRLEHATMGPFHYTLWSPANGACGNPDNFHCGIVLGLDSSLAGMRLPAKICRGDRRPESRLSSRALHLVHNECHSARDRHRHHPTWLSVSSYLQKAGKESIERRSVTSEHTSARHSRAGGVTCFSKRRVQTPIRKTMLRPFP